jgi:Tfp pilus assembly protein PilN
LKFSYVLEEIAKTVTSGVSLSSLNLAKKDKGMICSLRGFAEDRNSLLKFKENLEKNEIFSDVFFPQGSWVEPSDIDFTLNFKISEFK